MLGTVSQVFGSMVVVPVDATHVESMRFIVRTDTAGNASDEHAINFNVIADPQGPAPDDSMKWHLSGAHLRVYDGTNFISSQVISSCDLPGGPVPSFMQNVKTSSGTNGIFFSFEVSTNHLDSVQFEIWYTSGVHPAIMNYRFALRSFLR
jgi:hypothetical protein